MHDRASEVNNRRCGGREVFHHFQPPPPVTLRPRFSIGVEQRRTVQRNSPASLLRDDRGRLFISSQGLVRCGQHVARFLKARKDLARLQRLTHRFCRTCGKVMDPGDADVNEQRQRIEFARVEDLLQRFVVAPGDGENQTVNRMC